MQLRDFAYAKASAPPRDPASCPLLMQVLAEMWDGTERHAELIAAMLRSIHLAKLK